MENEVRYTGDVTTSNDSEMIVEGYALKFNKQSEILTTTDGKPFREVILPNALRNTDLSDVRMFSSHDSSQLLGRTTSSTLDLTVDEVGLYIKCTLPNTTTGRDTYELVKRGDMNQMSFLFEVSAKGQTWDYSDTIPLRMIHDIYRIQEVSAVSIPAYTDTELAVATRSLNKDLVNRDTLQILIQLELLKEF